MTCCDLPRVRQDSSNEKAACVSCGFQWRYDYQTKGKFTSKEKRWGPAWFCADDYDRGWRLKNYERHEVVGTRRRGKTESYVVCCPKSMNTISVSVAYPPDEVYCQDCDRSGDLGPMLMRHRDRKSEITDQ
jgi:hypothetical protein